MIGEKSSRLMTEFGWQELDLHDSWPYFAGCVAALGIVGRHGLDDYVEIPLALLSRLIVDSFFNVPVVYNVCCVLDSCLQNEDLVPYVHSRQGIST